MVIGLTLFIPIGFLAGFYQNKKRERLAAEEKEKEESSE
jgi:hypothetical protein